MVGVLVELNGPQRQDQAHTQNQPAVLSRFVITFLNWPISRPNHNFTTNSLHLGSIRLLLLHDPSEGTPRCRLLQVALPSLETKRVLLLRMQLRKVWSKRWVRSVKDGSPKCHEHHDDQKTPEEGSGATAKPTKTTTPYNLSHLFRPLSAFVSFLLANT